SEGGPVQGASASAVRAIAADVPTVPAKRPLCAEDSEAATVAAGASYEDPQKRSRHGEPSGAIAAVAAGMPIVTAVAVDLHTVPEHSAAVSDPHAVTAVAVDKPSVPAKRPLTTDSTTESTTDAIAANEPYPDPQKRLRSAASVATTSAPAIGIIRNKDSARRKKHVMFSLRNKHKEILHFLDEKKREVASEDNAASTPTSSSEGPESAAPEAPSETIDQELEERLQDARHKRKQIDMLAYFKPTSIVATPPVSRSSSASKEVATQDKPKRERRHTTLGWKALESGRRMRRPYPVPHHKNNPAEIEPAATTGSPLSGHKFYLLPFGVDECAYMTARDGVARLGGEWLGPPTKDLHAMVP
ncbi:hypothetical protein BG011_002784, partial [Mortierella polycephala]